MGPELTTRLRRIVLIITIKNMDRVAKSSRVLALALTRREMIVDGIVGCRYKLLSAVFYHFTSPFNITVILP